MNGFVGEIPKTAWVMDYPIFERIYYDLVAGFDVFGNVIHQVSTRLYMDHLRMQSENLFLGFLPADQREAIRASWYVGATRSSTTAVADRSARSTTARRSSSRDVDPKARAARDAARAARRPAAGPPDLINRCAEPPCDRPGATPTSVAVERELPALAAVQGRPWVPLLPEVVAPARARRDASGRAAISSTRSSTTTRTPTSRSCSARTSGRFPADDTLTVVRGHFGSYPNFFFEVDAAQIAAFVDELLALRSDADLERFVDATASAAPTRASGRCPTGCARI